MRRELRILLITVVFGASWAWGGRVPEAVASMEQFRITHVDVQGLHYLSRPEVMDALAVTDGSSVFGDTDAWAERLTVHPLVRSARVERRIPDGLLVVIEERTPVALVPTPTLEPVDGEGVILPLDPAEYRLDLPVVAAEQPLAPGSRLVPEDARILVAEVERLMVADTAFLQMVSEVSWREDRTIVARWTEPSVDFLMRPGVPAARLNAGLTVLADAASRSPHGVPDVIDLRFADQVVVRRNRQP
jgi:POTRA domain, FtsQ-type